MGGVVKVLRVKGELGDIGVTAVEGRHTGQAEDDKQEHEPFGEKVGKNGEGGGPEEGALAFSSEGGASPESVRDEVHSPIE